MSLESPWLGVLGEIFAPALGHLYHFILAVNIRVPPRLLQKYALARFTHELRTVHCG